MVIAISYLTGLLEGLEESWDLEESTQLSD